MSRKIIGVLFALLLFSTMSTAQQVSTSQQAWNQILDSHSTTAPYPLPVGRRAALIRLANTRLVNRCLSFVPVGASQVASDIQINLCSVNRFFNTYQGSSRHYTISRQNDGVHIRFKVRFHVPWDTPLDRVQDMMRSMNTCVSPIQELWSRYQIHLDLSLDEIHAPTAGAPDFNVSLPDSNGRSNTGYRMNTIVRNAVSLFDGTLYYRGQSRTSLSACVGGCTPEFFATARAERCYEICDGVRQENTCLTFLHEIGHMLGFPDEYEERNRCPNRQEIYGETNPWSAMDNQDMGWSAIEFMPRHIESLLQPLCPQLVTEFLPFRSGHPFRQINP